MNAKNRALVEACYRFLRAIGLEAGDGYLPELMESLAELAEDYPEIIKEAFTTADMQASATR